MQTTYRFKLIPSQQQDAEMTSWLGMICGMVNYNLADRIDSYNQGFIQGNFCVIRTKAETCPLTCSVVRSASNGEPWKEDKPSLRRGKGSKLFNPKRSAYEHLAAFPTFSKARWGLKRAVTITSLTDAHRAREEMYEESPIIV